MDETCSGVGVGTVEDELAHLGNVVVRDGFGEGELSSKDGWNSNFVRFDVDVGGNDGSGGVVDSLSLWFQGKIKGERLSEWVERKNEKTKKTNHHVHPKQSFLLLQKLLHSRRR